VKEETMGRGGKPGRVFRGTRTKLRAHYREMWQHDWPHDDAYLDLLWRTSLEAIPVSERGNLRIPIAEVYDACLMRMRENHPF
jgi:hypothetical protein